MTVIAIILWLRPPPSPPAISVTLLAYTNYTNRVGPYALLAITNHSQSSVSLSTVCMMLYGTKPLGSAPHRVTSIEGNTLRVTRLRAQEGFVQDVFVFPGAPAEWEFEFFASKRSTWLDLRRSAENWFHKHIRGSKYPFISKTWQILDSQWYPCPQ